MNKTGKTVLLILLVVVLVAGGVFVGMNWNSWFGEDDTPVTADLDENAEDYTGDRDVYQGDKNTDTISIPGFDIMNLQAGVKEQSVNLYNPEQNTCYFRMTLLLEDGTELWSSDLLEPGKAIYNITLNQTLEAGEYENASIRYECFTMDGNMTQLNGADMKMTLNVLE